MGLIDCLPEWLLEFVRDKRASKRERSRDIYRPILEQFNQALVQIRAGERAHALNRQFWTDLKNSGRADAIKSELRIRLEEIYEDFYPRHDHSWMEANGDGLREFLMELRKECGSPREYRPGIKFPTWQKFLTNDIFSVSSLELTDAHDVQLLDQFFLDLKKLPSHDLTMFLRECWQRADKIPVFRNVKESRTKLRTGISQSIADLKTNIVN